MKNETTKHTPGPWSISDAGDESDLTIVSESANSDVAFMGVWPDAEEECKANARLIALAPDLLEFARTYLDSESTTTALDREAKRLIAQAEGKAVPS